MSNIKNGGAAFPRVVPTKVDAATGAIVAQDIHTGMSLRDWFAGQALAGYIASFAGPDVALPKTDHIGVNCYKYADAMLAAREPKP